MKSMYTLLLIFCFSGFTQMGYAQNPTKNTVLEKTRIKINEGDAAQIKDVVVIFDELIEDSRCPKGTTCIWAGQAKVKLLVKERKKKTYPLILTLNPRAEGAKRICEKDGYTIYLDNVLPHPTGNKGKPAQYFIAVSKIEKVTVQEAKDKRDY